MRTLGTLGRYRGRQKPRDFESWPGAGNRRLPAGANGCRFAGRTSTGRDRGRLVFHLKSLGYDIAGIESGETALSAKAGVERALIPDGGAKTRIGICSGQGLTAQGAWMEPLDEEHRERAQGGMAFRRQQGRGMRRQEMRGDESAPHKADGVRWRFRDRGPFAPGGLRKA